MDKEFDEFDTDVQTELEAYTPYQNPTATVFEAIKLMEACPICGSKLHLTHFADYHQMTSFEASRCDECGYKSKKNMSRLQ